MAKVSDFLGGGSGVQLAPDLDFPSNIYQASSGVPSLVSNINSTAGLATALSLTGRFEIKMLAFVYATMPMTVKLTVDGEVIWNGTVTSGSTYTYLCGHTTNYLDSFICESSLLLEVEDGTSSTDFSFYVRPIK